MAWYPLSDILLHLCGLVTLAVIVVGVMIGYGPELIDRLVDVLFTSVAQQQSDFAPDAATIRRPRRWFSCCYRPFRAACG
jgi:hypothetical protein